MSIWTSFCTFGRIGSPRQGKPPEIDDLPYSSCVDSTSHWTTGNSESLASTPRDGFVDIARSGMCDLIRLSVEDVDAEVEVFLDRHQAAKMRDSLIKELGNG